MKKSNNKFKSKGRDTRRKDSRGNDRRTDEKKEFTKTHNDWRWYAANEQLLIDTASLPYSNVLGLPTGFVTEGNPVSGDTYAEYNNSVPGIMRLDLIQTMGAGKTSVDAPTVAARNIYSWVRHANSGSANYEAPDLMMMILAHASAASWLEAMKRAYGAILTFHTRNRYYGRQLVRAMGFNYELLSTNMARFREHINISSARLNSIKIPAGMPICDRWNWLSSNYFTDDDSIKSQIYVPRFETYFKFSGYSSETGTELISVTAPDYYTTSFDEIVTFTNELIEPLISEEDVGIMSGDIMKAYGDNVTSLSMISEDYVSVPAYNPEVLMQIHNSISLLDTESEMPLPGHTFTQEDGVIKESISYPIRNWVRDFFDYEKHYYVDRYNDNVTPAETMVSTRLMPTFSKTSYGAFTVNACGSEIVHRYTVFYNFDEGIKEHSSVVPDVSTILQVSMFNYHPITYVAPSWSNYAGVVGDFENYTVVDWGTLERMHKVAILNECAVTSYTKV